MDSMQLAFPASHFSYQTVDFFHASKELLKYFGDHQLKPVDSHSFLFREHVSPLGEIRLHHIEFVGGVTINDCHPQGHFLFHLVLKGEVDINRGKKKVRLFPGQAFIYGPEKAPSLTFPEGGYLLIVQIHSDYLTRFARQLISHSPQQALLFNQTGFHAKSVQQFLQVVSLLQQCHRDNADAPNLGVRQQQAEQFLMSQMLLDFENSYSPWLRKQSPELESRIVRAAREYIDAHISQSITLDDLCHAAEVSKRSLLYAFNQYCGTTPMKYVMGLRLDGLYEDLLAGGQELTVTEAALKWGLNNPGRLSQYYKDRFGELPSATLGK